MNLLDHIPLGRSGLTVSRLGIGAGYGVPQNAIEKAYHEHGLNYLYWSLPRRKGMTHAIRHLAKTERDKLVIAIQIYMRGGLFTPAILEHSLKKLHLDYADVLLLGWYNYRPGKGILGAAQKLKEQGKIRAIAMSGHNRNTFGRMAREQDGPIDIFMMRYNAAHRGAEQDIFPHLPDNNRPGIISYTATDWGKLLKAKKMPPGEPPMTAPDCYRFALANPNVDMCLIGVKNMQQMDDALNVYQQGPPSKEEMERFRRIGDHVYGKKRA